MALQIELQDWEALVALAREGVKNDAGEIDKEAARKLETFLRSVEKKNNINRYLLWVLWQEAGQQLPPTVRFPDKWPPEMRRLIELTSRPIAKADVEAVLTQHAKNPTNVMVTKDPGGEVGWTELDVFFIT